MSASRVADLGALADRALGAYLGLAIGDALGATVEFMTPREIAQRFASQGGLHRHIIGGGWLKLQPGQVTDDTTMSLALGEALLRGHRDGLGLDTRLIAEAFVTWWRAKPVDCGNTCRRGILRYRNEGSLQGQPIAVANHSDCRNTLAISKRRPAPSNCATEGGTAIITPMRLRMATDQTAVPMATAACVSAE